MKHVERFIVVLPRGFFVFNVILGPVSGKP